MASYGYEYDYPPRRTHVREIREERREDPRFYDHRDYGRGQLIPRGREDSDLSVEEIRRDFPPPAGREIRRARSVEPSYYDSDDEYYDHRRDHDHRSKKSASVYHEEIERKSKHHSISKQEKIIAAVAGAALLAGGKELLDRRGAKEEGTDIQRNPFASAALAGVGALAAYQGAGYYNKYQAKKDQKATYILHQGRDGHMSEYYSDEEAGSGKTKKGNRNFLESALAATGLGAAAKGLIGGGDHHSDTRSVGSRSHSRGGNNKMQKAAMASLLAGATEAFRVAKEPGSWKGEKTRRIITAAAGAATVDAAHGAKHGKLGLAESVIGGLVGNRLINGSKTEIEEDKMTGRSRSRSRARSSSRGSGGGTGLAALASAGLGAFGAKKAFDAHRSRSRSRAASEESRGRYDSRGPSPEPSRRSRSRSVVDKARNSLAKFGIGNGAPSEDGGSRRRHQDDFDDRSSRHSRRYSDEYDDYRPSRGGHHDYYEDDRSHRSRRGGGRSDYGSDTDLGDSDEETRKHRKMKGKAVWSSGLAAVAVAHAAKEFNGSIKRSKARRKAISEGKMTPMEAKKLKTKSLMQDAASMGIVTLCVKGAIGEIKGVREQAKECTKFKQERVVRHQKREQVRKGLIAPSATRKKAETWTASEDRLYDSSSEYDSDDDDAHLSYGQYTATTTTTKQPPKRANTLPPPPMQGFGYGPQGGP